MLLVVLFKHVLLLQDLEQHQGFVQEGLHLLFCELMSKTDRTIPVGRAEANMAGQFQMQGTHAFDPLLQLVVDEEGQVLRGMSVEVENVLKVRYDGLLAQFVVVEGMSEEMVKLGLEVQKVLWKREKKTP